MSKVIGIIGSRRRDTDKDYYAVYNEFKKWYDIGDRICSGGCKKGGDRFAEIIARKLGLTEENGGLILHLPKPVPSSSPKWAYAKANFERNTIVARDSDMLIACVGLDRKGGTEDTIRKFIRQGKDKFMVRLV